MTAEQLVRYAANLRRRFTPEDVERLRGAFPDRDIVATMAMVAEDYAAQQFVGVNIAGYHVSRPR